MQRTASQRLLDALESSEIIQNRVIGQSFEQFQSDLMFRDGLERRLEIVGEALTKAFDELPGLRDQFAANRQITGMRNRIAHGYFDLDERVLWATLTEDIPPTINVLTSLVALSSDELERRFGS